MSTTEREMNFVVERPTDFEGETHGPGPGVLGLENVVLPVAIRADRRCNVAPGGELSVDSLVVLRSDRGVTLTARPGDVEVIDRRLRVAGRQDGVRAAVGGVAVHAIGGRRVARQRRAPVDAGLVDLHRMLKSNAVLGREQIVFVALGAGERHVPVVDRRVLVVHVANVVRAVTVHTARHVWIFTDNGVRVANVSVDHVVVTQAAVDPGQAFFVRKLHDGFVTVDAVEVGVNAVREGGQRSLIWIAVVHGMAIQTLVRILGTNVGRSRGQEQECERNRTESQTSTAHG